jgi:hypothetical protein
MSRFKISLKESLPSGIAIFACAAIMVLCSRFALGLLETNGALSYIYATSGSGTILEQMCEIFTGTSIVALVAIGGIIGGMIAGLFGSTGWRFARSFPRRSTGVVPQGSARDTASNAAANAAVNAAASAERPALLAQFVVFALWALVATVAVVAVFALVFLGTISDVQLTSVTSKLGAGGTGGSSASTLMLPLTLTMLWSLLLMGGSLVFAAVSAGRRARREAFTTVSFLLVSALLVGVLLLLLSVALFTRFNVMNIDYTSLSTWLGISIAANLAVTALGLCLSRVFINRK